MRSFRTKLVTFGFISIIFLFCVDLASAATFTVSKTADTADGTCDADCSLREAIDAANAAAGDDDIVFSALFNTTQTILLTDGGDDLDITSNITITGPGAHLLTIDQSNTARVFDITSGNTVTITGVSIIGGAEDADGLNGGGVRNDGTLTLTNVLVSGNDVTNANGDGGGIYNSGTMTITSSRITGNEAADDGAGIYNTGTLTVLNSSIDNNTTTVGGLTNNDGGGLFNDGAGDTITIYNSTVTNNHADDDGGGIFNNSNATLNINNSTISHNDASGSGSGSGGGISDGSTTNIRNTIVANNTAEAADETDVAGNFTSSATAGGNNLIGIVGYPGSGFTNGVNGDQVGTVAAPIDPLLGPLQNNFGPTPTRAITTSSPAYNAGNNCVFDSTCTANNPSPALTLDQRGTGFERNFANTVDIGAFEFKIGPSAASVSLSGRVMTEYGRGISRVAVTLTGGPLAEPMQVFTGSFGYYTFNDVPGGQSYIISVRAKQHVFANPTLPVTADDNISGLDFIADRVILKPEK